MQMVSTTLKPEAGEVEEMGPEFKRDPRPRLYIDDDLVEALGIKGIPTPGTVFTIQARAVAERVSAEVEEPGEGEGKTPDVELCLLITDIGMEQGSANNEQRASMLYGD